LDKERGLARDKTILSHAPYERTVNTDEGVTVNSYPSTFHQGHVLTLSKWVPMCKTNQPAMDSVTSSRAGKCGDYTLWDVSCEIVRNDNNDEGAPRMDSEFNTFRDQMNF